MSRYRRKASNDKDLQGSSGGNGSSMLDAVTDRPRIMI